MLILLRDHFTIIYLACFFEDNPPLLIMPSEFGLLMVWSVSLIAGIRLVSGTLVQSG